MPIDSKRPTHKNVFEIEIVKYFVVSDDVAIHVLVVLRLFLTDQPHILDLVSYSIINHEACFSVIEFLLIVTALEKRTNLEILNTASSTRNIMSNINRRHA